MVAGEPAESVGSQAAATLRVLPIGRLQSS